MRKRLKIPQNIQASVLVDSRRRCCICFGLNKDITIKEGQIAHLDGNPSNITQDNLVFLCLKHHDQYDSRTSQSKGFTIDEVKSYRTKLASYINNNFPVDTNSSDQHSRTKILLPQLASGEVEIGETNIKIKNLNDVASHLGITETHLSDGIINISAIFDRINMAKLTHNQGHLLAIVVDNADNLSVYRRIVESAAGYDYLSREFYDEMIVLEYKGFINFSKEDDGYIYLPHDDYQTWELIKEMSEISGISMDTLIRQPKIELLFPIK